jgi:uroporphyrin-III C-methyltransferase/precorrin-2 dehydrogenase/sirohydrochlorin ferrochelatase
VKNTSISGRGLAVGVNGNEKRLRMKYLPLFADLREQTTVVIGGGEIAARKLRVLLRAQAKPLVFAVAPNKEIEDLENAGLIRLRHSEFDTTELIGCCLVVVADAEEARAGEIAATARQAGIPVNVVDRPELSSVIMPGIIDRDPVLIAISSSGHAPVLVRRLREKLETLLPARLGDLATFAGRYRQAVATAIQEPRRRLRFWEQFFEGPIARTVLAGRNGEAADAMLRLVNLDTPAPEAGSVALVGAGPGDPDLLTLRALRTLQDADVVLHDALIDERMLDYVRRDARRIDVGKRKGRHSHSQDTINQLLLDEARKGNRVVRLKGGDPFIFGRGGEEMAYLRARGIEVEVVPGITAAAGAAAAAGIPLTHRGLASAVTFITGHGQASSPDLDWAALATGGQTLVLYMGVSTIREVSEKLITHGMAPSMPVAVIENATLPHQRILRSRLDQLAETCAVENVRAPALILIGEVVGLAHVDEATEYPSLAAVN